MAVAPKIQPMPKSISKTKPTQKPKATVMPASASKVTPFQLRVYSHLLTIPAGKVASYLTMSQALNSSPRAVGNALRNNPFAPTVPCHRVIAASGYIGGFKGEWNDAPSGVNQSMKRDLLKDEGVAFSDDGMLVTGRKAWFDGWDEKEVAKQRIVVEDLIKAGVVTS
jgi:methylated-DNA-[protein]-cysteine S-methyltransferase